MRSPWLIPGLGVIAILGLFLPFLGVPFEYDDKVEIVANEVLRNPGEFWEIWNYNPFRVLLLYTFSADIWAWGILRPEGYRAVNIAIHCGNTVMLSLLLRRLGAGPLWAPSTTQRHLFTAAGTLLFAVHPLAIESVTYVSGRSSSLATAFVLASVIFYLRHRDGSAEPAVAEWLRAQMTRTNRLLTALLAGALGVGLPCAWAAQRGAITEGRALLFTLAAGGAALVLTLGIRGRAWLALGVPEAGEDVARAGRRAALAWLLAFVSFVLGCLTKEIAATLPAILLLLEAHWFHTSWRSSLGSLRGRLFPFFGIPAALIILRATTYGYIASPIPIRPWTDNLATQVEVFWHYVRLWLLPYPQSIYHAYPVVPFPGTATTWLAALALAALALGMLRLRGRAPALAFGLLVLLGTLAPTTSIFALKETMVEHRTYLPSVGYSFAAAWLFGVFLPRFLKVRATGALLAGLLVLFGTLHISYDLLWRSEEVLWSQAVSVNPGASDAWRNLGDLYRSEGRTQDARKAFKAASAASPTNVEARTALAVQEALDGRLDEAEVLLRDTLRIAPCHGPAINNLAMVENRRGNWQGAVDLYDRALKCDPQNAMTHLGLGNLYFGPLKSRPKAAEHYQSFLDIADPLHPAAAPIKQRLLDLTW
jgi:tetratricopeptide (TPR) repeat protein